MKALAVSISFRGAINLPQLPITGFRIVGYPSSSIAFNAASSVKASIVFGEGILFLVRVIDVKALFPHIIAA